MKFALIGCGRIGTRHAEIMSEMGDLISVCDISRLRAEKIGKKHNAKVFTDFYNFIRYTYEKLDLIAICTPNGLHAEHTIKMLDYANVLVEKPMALTTIDCGRMIQKAEKSNKRLFVVKQNRFNPPVVAVKHEIEGRDNKIGKVYSIALNCYWNRDEDYYQDWRGTKKLDGGTLYTQFSHFLDLLYWMFGDIKTVQAITKNYNHDYIEFEDTGVVLLEFENGIIGTVNYTVSAVNKNMEGSLTIFAEKATIKIGGQYLNELDYQEPVIFKDLPKGNPPNNYGNYVGSMSNHKDVYFNVVKTLEGIDKIVTSHYEGLKTVELIERIYKSVK